MSVHLNIAPRRTALALAALLASCSSAAEKASVDAGPPSLEIGTGSTKFEPLVEGGEILIVQGPQGGYHFFGSLNAKNINPGNSEDLLDPSNPNTTFAAYADGVQIDVGASTYRQGLESTTAGEQMIGRRVILDIVDDSELAGKEVRFVVKVQDADGIMLRDERKLIATPHPDNR